MKTLIIFLINFIAACNGIATNNMEVTGSKKSKYKQTFNNMVMIYLQLPQTSNSIESNNEPPLTENENSTLTPNVQNQVFYLSEYELKENLKIENDMKDKGLLKENILKTIGENYVQMVTYPQPTQDDIDSMIDEKSLGIEHKKREYSITELQSKKQESLNQIYSYYNNLELKIATTPDEQLHTLRINMVNAIFMHDKIKEYCKGDSNFPEEVLGLNLYWLNRIRIEVIKEQIKRGLIDENAEYN